MNQNSEENNKFSKVEALWRQAGLVYGLTGVPICNLSNVALALEKHWPYHDRIRMRADHCQKLEIQTEHDIWRPWTAIDGIKLTRWLQEEVFFHRVTPTLVSQALWCIAKPHD